MVTGIQEKRHNNVAKVRVENCWADAVLDRLVLHRRRPSDPWFDQECRDAKRRVRRLERASSRAPTELPLQILFLPKSLKRPLLPLLGQLSVAHTETFTPET